MKIMDSKALLTLILVIIVGTFGVQARENIDFFLPAGEYEAAVPTPESFFGFQVGEWHVQHAPLVYYFMALADASDRAMVYEYGWTYENRPMIQMVITSPANHDKLEQIRRQHLALTDPSRSAGLDVDEMPVVVMLGYGVHGNEPSAHNAAPLVAYYLAASKNEEMLRMLENMVVIIDPSLNPDGQDRFASWVNRHKSHTLVSDPSDREFSDVWPGGRSNHYWFDLNRDWLGAQHPEIRGKISQFHHWKPNINTDHHEFGANSTFFFQPGVPTRVNPHTPLQTNELTYDIAAYHAAMLDQIGSLYYMEQGFDDYYYGKGSAYPDVNGSIGILFEQGGTKGHLRETVHGIQSFAFTIRNQVRVSLSTLRAAQDMRIPLLEHLRWFHSSALDLAAEDPVKAYVFGDLHDQGRNYHFLDILHTHQIDAYALKEPLNDGGGEFAPGRAWVVPLRQPQYRLIKSLFEPVTEFEDSLFYDVSTWTMPLAFQMPCRPVMNPARAASITEGDPAVAMFPVGKVMEGEGSYAWVFSWEEYYAPRALFHLQKNGIRTKVATRPFSIAYRGQRVDMDFGSILIHVNTQDESPEVLRKLVEEAAAVSGVTVYPVSTGLTVDGIHLGSGSFSNLQKPEILMLVGSGVTSSEAGQVWHLLDQRYRLPVTKAEVSAFRGLNLARYNTLVMVSGSYGSLNDTSVEALREWLRGGGTLIAIRSGNNWLNRQGIIDLQYRRDSPSHMPRLSYESMSEYRGARSIPGSIFQTDLDLTHPLGYGYKRAVLPVFVRGFSVVDPATGPFSNPVVFGQNSLLSGYVYPPYAPLVDGSAGVVVTSVGRGTVISFMDDPNFRAFWFGTNKLFANALFFGGIVRN
jgi:hypothetical protein